MKANINLTDQSEQNLIKIKLEILKATGKNLKSKEELINAAIALASESCEFLDNESIKNILNPKP